MLVFQYFLNKEVYQNLANFLLFKNKIIDLVPKMKEFPCPFEKEKRFPFPIVVKQ